MATCVRVPVADNMKNTKKITLCGVTAALSVTVMLGSYFPYLTYAIPAIAGLFMMVPLVECGTSWAFGCYAVSSVIVFTVGETEAKILYVLFFGFYPILKAVIERINRQFFEWILKLSVFNVAAVLSYFVSSRLFSVSFDEFGEWGKYGAIVFLMLCNIVFVIYDIGISRVASYYTATLHNKIKSILK